MSKATITPDLLRHALQHVSPAMDRDTWARIGMAIKSEFPDAIGFELFDSWSRGDEQGYDPQALRATWRSLKAGGGVTVATLLMMAKDGGYQVPAALQPPAARAPAPTPAEPDSSASHTAAAKRAAGMCSRATQVEVHPYLERKGVKPFGVLALDGWLLVPMRDAAGQLWNVQRIAGAKPSSGPDKLFLKGGRKTGLWHWCGAPDGGSDRLLLCEGYATGASLHEATGLPVAVAFDAGNLVHVAKQIHEHFPKAEILVCGDDDKATEGRTGRNPGRLKAQTAARAAGGRAVFPAPLPDGGTDFNDLHQAHGLQAVRACVETSAQQADEAAEVFDSFRVDDSGVWHRRRDKEGRQPSWEWVCSRLEVEAHTRDQDGTGWGYLLTFADPRGVRKQWAMPARMLAGDGSEYRATLLHQGLRIASARESRNLLTQYIQTREPQTLALSTERIGWHGFAFVLPRETLGDAEERVVFQSENAMENTFGVKGTLADWHRRVAALCEGNARLVFAVCCAFAGPLLKPAGVESGGFHFRGDSSSGKTTALRVAASVYGGANYMQRWRTTDNALEVIAAQHNDCLLILDELAQVDPKTAGECAYMLANEQSKARATRTGLPRPRLTWRLLFLSAGELGLADHMAEGMKRTRTGQEVRMADVPVDAGAGMGAFEDLHGIEGAAGFARVIAGHAAGTYGAAGRAWLQWLTQRAGELKPLIREKAERIAQQLVPEGASGQVERVAMRFAIVGAAGELATEAGITGWSAGEAKRGAVKCFEAWLQARGGADNGEVSGMLRQVRHFLEASGEGRFTWWHRAADDHSAKTLQRAGFRRLVTKDGHPIRTNGEHWQEFGDRMPASTGEDVAVEYYILSEVFRTEVCKGFDYQAVARVLREHECLVTEKDRLDVKTRLPGLGLARCYRIVPAIFSLDL